MKNRSKVALRKSKDALGMNGESLRALWSFVPQIFVWVLVFGSASRPRRLHDRTPILIIVRLLGAEILDHLKTKNMFSPINSTSISTNPTLKKTQ